MAPDMDPLGIFPATSSVLRRAAGRPAMLGAAFTKAMFKSAQLPAVAVGRALGVDLDGPVATNPKDRRFANPAWEQNPAFYTLRQAYLLGCELIDAVVDAGRSGEVSDRKTDLLRELIENALAPTNSPLTNPDVLTRALQTGGRSLTKGASYALDDIRHRGGMPLKVDRSAFTLGKDLAATPGEVVFRGDLIEVMQYHPQTETVGEVPILMVPPWINKYYVMDLAPGRSLFEWAIQHGRTVFTISYRNPDDSMSDLRMDDYLEQGTLTALEVAQAITGSERVDLVALCLGGALSTMTAAYLAQDSTSPIASLTLLNTELDYSEPGVLGTAVDPTTLTKIDQRMAQTGYLPAEDMARTFDMLRSNDLIFNYVVSRWLMGQEPRPFDILAWNDDSTRMPAAMHSRYLKALYGENQLARGKFEIGGRVLNLGDVTCDTYLVGAINDHIVPWQASYQATKLLSGDVRYVLSSGGHIAGVVNPPTPKAWFKSNDLVTDDPQAWLASATQQTGSWWEDWSSWSAPRSGGQRKPPKMGNRKYRALDPAPGTYVFGGTAG